MSYENGDGPGIAPTTLCQMRLQYPYFSQKEAEVIALAIIAALPPPADTEKLALIQSIIFLAKIEADKDQSPGANAAIAWRTIGQIERALACTE